MKLISIILLVLASLTFSQVVDEAKYKSVLKTVNEIKSDKSKQGRSKIKTFLTNMEQTYELNTNGMVYLQWECHTKSCSEVGMRVFVNPLLRGDLNDEKLAAEIMAYIFAMGVNKVSYYSNNDGTGQKYMRKDWKKDYRMLTGLD